MSELLEKAVEIFLDNANGDIDLPIGDGVVENILENIDTGDNLFTDLDEGHDLLSDLKDLSSAGSDSFDDEKTSVFYDLSSNNISFGANKTINGKIYIDNGKITLTSVGGNKKTFDVFVNSCTRYIIYQGIPIKMTGTQIKIDGIDYVLKK